jgi:hypothetical protein
MTRRGLIGLTAMARWLISAREKEVDAVAMVSAVTSEEKRLCGTRTGTDVNRVPADAARATREGIATMRDTWV